MIREFFLLLLRIKVLLIFFVGCNTASSNLPFGNDLDDFKDDFFNGSERREDDLPEGGVVNDLATETDAETKTETKTENKAETEADTEAGTDAETKTENKAGTEADMEAGTDAETKTENKAGTEADMEADTEAESIGFGERVGRSLNWDGENSWGGGIRLESVASMVNETKRSKGSKETKGTKGTRLAMSGARGVATTTSGGTTYLFVTGFQDDGLSMLSMFEVRSDGSLVSVTNVSDDDRLQLAGASGVTTAMVGRKTYVFVAGASDHGVSVFLLEGRGKSAQKVVQLKSVHNVSDEESAGLNLAGAWGITTLEMSGSVYLFVTGTLDHGFSVFQVEEDGSLRHEGSHSDSEYSFFDLKLRGARGIGSLEVEGMSYLLVTGAEDDGFSVFLNLDGRPASGVLTNVSDDGALELAGAWGVAFSEIGGRNYILVTGREDDGISMFHWAEGQLTSVTNLRNGGEVQLAGARGIVAGEFGGENYVFVASYQGISVFQVTSNGVLTNVFNLGSASVLNLGRVVTLALAKVGQADYLFAVGEGGGEAVRVFRVLTED